MITKVKKFTKELVLEVMEKYKKENMKKKVKRLIDIFTTSIKTLLI